MWRRDSSITVGEEALEEQQKLEQNESHGNLNGDDEEEMNISKASTFCW